MALLKLRFTDCVQRVWLPVAMAVFLVLGCGAEGAGSKSGAAGGESRSVILFIGDGMGAEHVRAGGMYAHGAEGTLSFESLPYRGTVLTRSANSSVTDSAAAATAMATGRKVSNGVISMAIPGDGSLLPTVIELFQAAGKSAGLVSTAFITHATPAAFGAHEPSRENYGAIAEDYLHDSRPLVLLGGAMYVTPEAARNGGYVVVMDRASLFAVDVKRTTRVWGQFGEDHMPYEADGVGFLPHLSEMTRVALDILSTDPDGFFLMVEGGRIDHASHDNDIGRAVGEVAEFDRAIRVALDWAGGRENTLVLVTADHETGGLEVLASAGVGNAPSVSWKTTGHTGATVPVYGMGPGSEGIREKMDNTDLFELMMANLPQRDSENRLLEPVR